MVFVKNERMNHDHVDTALELSLNSCMWVDGLHNQVYLRTKAIPEMKEYLESVEVSNDIYDPSSVMMAFMQKLIELHEIYCGNMEFCCDEDHELGLFIQDNMLYDDDDRHIPIPVFSYVKPTLGPRFILHILLSLGEFETEIDLILHENLRESFRYAKLIGLENDEASLKEYSSHLLKRYIEEQLIFFPNSIKVLSQWIVTAGCLFDSVIIIIKVPMGTNVSMNPLIEARKLKKFRTIF